MYQVIVKARFLGGWFYLAFKNNIGPLATEIVIHEPLESWEVGQLLGGN